MNPLLPPPPDVVVIPITYTRALCYKEENGTPEKFDYEGIVDETSVRRRIPKKDTLYFQYQTVIVKKTFTLGQETGKVEEPSTLSKKMYLQT